MSKHIDQAAKSGAEPGDESNPEALGDLPEAQVAPESADGVRGGASLPAEKRRQIANDTTRPPT
jgi:hypothetical protein